MKKVLLVTTLLAAIGTCSAQNGFDSSGIKAIELQNSTDTSGPKPVFRRDLYHKACLNLITLVHGCDASPAIHYGTQIGVNVNIFQVNGGAENRTRMVQIGKYDWTDKFVVPVVVPWEQLGPGETRTLNVNASGGDGASGAPGKNADGTPARQVAASRNPRKDYASADVSIQVSSTIKGKDGKVRSDPYTPYVEAKKGYMYAARLVDGEKDYYVLVRVEDIVDGKAIKLSYMKLDLPPLL